jgi:putative inorganic carbon (HCO3(-)) transporter
VTAIGIRFQQYSLAALAPLVAILFWSGTRDPVNLPKATLAASVAILLAAVSLVRTVATRRLTLPIAPVVWAVAAFAMGLLAATALSDVPGASVSGTFGRNDGLLLYGSCVVLFLVGARCLDAEGARWLLIGLLGGGTFAAGYGLLQYFDLDPINWADVGLSPVIAAFGNPDFESGYLGIAVPAAAWGALTRTWSTPWRVGCALLAAGFIAVALLSSSVQGPLAAMAGVGVLGAALLLERGGAWARRGLLGLGAAVLVLASVTLIGLLAGVGPGERLTSAGSLNARKWYWGSALSMWRQHPLSGVGLDRYGAYYRSVRPDAAAAINNYSDAAHSVPLHLLATGGLLVALPYLVVVVLVVGVLVRGLRRQQGEARLLLAALGGAWVAYQVQSMVSIDEPGLAVTHWLLAAGVVAAANPLQFYVRVLPGAVLPRVRKGRGAVVDTAPPAVWSSATLAISAGVCVGALIVFWLVLKPLRADHNARSAAVELAQGNGNAALDRLDRATRLAPYQYVYWLQRGQFLERVKQPTLAASSYAAGLKRDPRAYDLLVAAAALARVQNDRTSLDRYSRQLSLVDPSGRWRVTVGS